MVYLEHHVVLSPATETLVIIAVIILAFVLVLLAASIAFLAFSIIRLPLVLGKIAQDQKERLVEKKQH